MAQMVKSPPAVRRTRVRSLGQGVKNGFRFSEQEASNFKSKSEVIGFML